MSKLQDGLDLLTVKYSAENACLCEDGVAIGGKTYPLLPWESERRFAELKDLAANTIGNLCTFRVEHISSCNADIFALLKREAGVIEFVTNDRITEIFCVSSGKSLNAVAVVSSGCVCTVELASTLKDGEEDVDKHEVIADNGVACDMVVDTQVKQQSIYVLSNEKANYRDTDTELFGLGEYEVSVVRNAFLLASKPALREHNALQNAHLDAVVEAARRSLETNENERV